MTLDEKLAQIGSYWIYDLQTNGQLDRAKTEEKLKHGIGQITRVAGASTLDPVGCGKDSQLSAKISGRKAPACGIPAIVHEECCSGAMVLGGTMFPQMLGACQHLPARAC